MRGNFPLGQIPPGKGAQSHPMDANHGIPVKKRVILTLNEPAAGTPPTTK